jgi:DNA-binding MarR family transcriptional regulator
VGGVGTVLGAGTAEVDVHSVFFAAKRAHLSTVKFFREVLLRVELTPARYDLLLFLHHKGGELTQKQLRAAFGVSRATMSEAVRSLVELGLVVRGAAFDRRTFSVCLTERGRRVFDHARRMTKGLVTRVLEKLFDDGDRLMEMHFAIGRHSHVRSVFGDTAVPELVWLWHPDN